VSSFLNFYYAQQLKRYNIQFMAIFAGMNVQVGKNENNEPRLAKVPCTFASKDRIVGAIKGENTQNKPIRLPIMSAWLSNLRLTPERRKGVPTQRCKAYMPTGSLFPDDIKVVEQRMPIPYAGTYDLHIWASNQDQHYQILEQIMMIFPPNLQIQTSDEPFDWTKITQVELVDMRLEENIPMGSDRRVVQSVFSFDVPIWISVPADVHSRFVHDIFVRVGAVSTGATNSYEIVAELDAQGIPYDLAFTLDDVDFDKT